MIPRRRTSQFSYHVLVSRLGFWLLFSIFVMPVSLLAQINGIAPSVTSIGFGPQPNPGLPPTVTAFGPNAPPSVTSLGPNGFHGNNRFVTTPLFPKDSNRFRHHHHVMLPYALPIYAAPYYGDYAGVASAPVDDSMEEDAELGGPTIFDRRGPGPRAEAPDRNHSRYADDAPSPKAQARTDSAPAAPEVDDQPATVLVFKDGHQVEVKNYAIKGNVLYDLSPGRSRKIELADLNLDATRKQNDDRGIDFQLPARQSGD